MSTIVNAGPVLVFLRATDPDHQDNIDTMLARIPEAVFLTMTLKEDGKDEWMGLVERPGGGFEWKDITELGRKTATLERVK